MLVGQSIQSSRFSDPLFSYQQATLDLPILLFGCSLFIFIGGFFFFPSAKSLNDWFYFVVTPLTLLNARKIPWVVFRKDWLVQCFLAYLFYCILSEVWSPALSWPSFFKPLVQALFLVVFFLTVQLTKQLPKALLDSFVDWLLWLSALSAIASIYIWYAHHGLDTRLVGFFRTTHPILSDWVYGIPVVIAAYRFITRPSFNKALSSLLLSLPPLAYVLLTQSRGPVLALVLAVAVFLLQYRNLRSFGIFCLFLSVAVFSHTLLARSFDTVFFREAIWKTVYELSLQNLWFGHGYITTLKVEAVNQLFSHAHNIYLEIFYLGGLVGVLLQSILILGTLVRAWQHRYSRVMVVLAVIFIFGLLCLATDGGRLVENPRELWMNFWLPLFAIMSYTAAKRDPYRL